MKLDGLAGRRVLVTAGASGIGAKVAEAFGQQGARVHIGDVNADFVDDFVRGHPTVGATVCDISSSTEVERLFVDVQSELGGLDVLVSGAGIAGPVAKVEEVNEAGWRRTLDINLTGAYLVTRRAVPLLKAQRSGCIVIISSVSGLFGERARTPYVATKWALIGFTKTLAMELGCDGIRANAVCPGPTEGERIERVLRAESAARGCTSEDLRAHLCLGNSMHTFVTADDVAAAILFLCSDAGVHVSGQALGVDGHTEFI